MIFPKILKHWEVYWTPASWYPAFLQVLMHVDGELFVTDICFCNKRFGLSSTHSPTQGAVVYTFILQVPPHFWFRFPGHTLLHSLSALITDQCGGVLPQKHWEVYWTPASWYPAFLQALMHLDGELSVTDMIFCNKRFGLSSTHCPENVEEAERKTINETDSDFYHKI